MISQPNLRLKQERERLNWTQQKVALEIGTTSINVSRWERGLTLPGPRFRLRLCELFKKSSEELGLVRASQPGLTPQLVYPRPALNGHHNANQPSWIYDASMPNLALAFEELIGRAALLETLKEQLCTTHGQFALSGLPGVGKTALAIMLAHDPHIQDRFRDGILWAGLGNHPHIEGLLGRWGTLVGLAEADMSKLTGSTAWARALCDTIGRRHILFIIDDAWKIEDALLCKVGGPNCSYLLTTRFPELALLFARDHATPVHELSEADSAILMRQFVPEITSGESHEVRELMRSIGGLPLALTLVGKYLRLQSHSGQPRRLLAALERLRDADERLKLAEPRSLVEGTAISLSAVIEVSDQQLKPEAHAALRALAIFPAKPNTFSEEAALAVSCSSEEALDELFSAGLLESSLPNRYTLHQSIADYARLQQGHDQAADSLIDFFVAFAEKHATNYDYKTFSLDFTNILAAFQLAERHGRQAELIRGVNAFAPFMEIAGHYNAAETYLEYARQAALDCDDEQGLAEIYFHLGGIAEARGERERAEAFLQQSLLRARAVGRRELMSAILARWGSLIVNSGDYPRAQQYLLEGLNLAREFNDRRRMGVLLRNLGEVADGGGDYERGEELYLQGLALAREVMDRENMSALLQNLGVKASERGNFPQANAYYQEGLLWAQQLGHRQRISALLMNIGMLAFEQQQYEEARALYQESLELARQLENRLRMGAVLQNLGMLERHFEHFALATSYLQESLNLARQIDNPWQISETLNEWGELYLQQHDLSAAHSTFTEALQLSRNLRALDLVHAALYGLARVAAANHDIASARHYGSESLNCLTLHADRRIGEITTWLATLPAEES